MVNISQTFVTYHGSGNGYLDEIRRIVQKNRKCIRATHYPFRKKPIDVRNRVETRAQIKLKPKATKGSLKRYMHYLNHFSKEYFSLDENLTSDNESNTETSDEESIAGNASDAEQNLSSEDEKPHTSTTGEDLILDEITAHEHEHPLSCSCTQTHSISDIRNPDNKNNTQNPDNKNETNNQALPLTICL